jgi:alpha-ribazole phosphatase
LDLILVRHTTLNIKPGICYGQSDVLPSQKFPEEAEAVKKHLNGIVPEKVYSSPLQRCVKLAEVCGYADVHKDNRLIEMDFGVWELVPWANIYGEYAKKWMENYHTWPTPNGESLEDVINRLTIFLNEIKATGLKTVLCFTHSGPIRIFHHLIDKLPLDDLFKIEIEYGGIYKFRI